MAFEPFSCSSYPDPISWNQWELSPRETQILHLMAVCMPMEEIADLLGISPRTVEKHVENISLKVQRRTYIGIAQYAIKNGYGKQQSVVS